VFAGNGNDNEQIGGLRRQGSNLIRLSLTSNLAGAAWGYVSIVAELLLAWDGRCIDESAAAEAKNKKSTGKLRAAGEASERRELRVK
jgi:hypothetical protein